MEKVTVILSLYPLQDEDGPIQVRHRQKTHQWGSALAWQTSVLLVGFVPCFNVELVNHVNNVAMLDFGTDNCILF